VGRHAAGRHDGGQRAGPLRALSTRVGFHHLAFRVDRENFELAQQDLRAAGIEFEFADHDVSHSIYFSDPDGVRLELTTYEE
jgi:catechol 2,3-dioxygenase-like lactoylglutathione lyase family enzyme